MSIVRSVLCFAVALTVAQPALAQQARFRLSDLDLRDPHVFVLLPIIGCTDVTDTEIGGSSFNGGLQESIQTDGDGDGVLDLSFLVEFLPLDQSAPTNLVDTGTADCRAPAAGTVCGPLLPAGLAGDATLLPTGQCLTFLPGTVRPYNPAVTSTGSPCFVTPAGNLTLDLDGIALTLRDAQLAATFVGNPAETLTNGLIRGFLTEADANATFVPASFPIIGGRSVASLLAGGNGSCRQTPSDKDTQDGSPGGTPGWWFYLNFPAARVGTDTFPNGFSDGFE